jgi:DNA-binding CsgD family transcriptional regulator
MVAKEAVLEWLFERLPIGLIFTDQHLRVIAQNKKATDLLQGSQAPQGEIFSLEGLSHEGLQEERYFSIERGEQSPLEVQMLPVRGGSSGKNTLVFLLYTPGEHCQISPKILQQRYLLTPAECKLTMLLLRGLSLQVAAGLLGVQVETVRSQLKSIFSKTNTKRQSELLLVLSVPRLLSE